MRKWFLLALIVGLLALAAAPIFAGGNGKGLERAAEVQDRHTRGLLNIPGVLGTGVSLDAGGDAVVVVLA